MSDYIPLPRDFRSHHVSSSSYGRRDEGPYPASAPAPHVTRVSYGSTIGNHPSWTSNFSPHAGIKSPPHPSGPRSPSQALSPRQPISSSTPEPSSQNPPYASPTARDDPLQDMRTLPPRPWMTQQNYDAGFPNPRSPPPQLRDKVQPPTIIIPPDQDPNDRSWISVNPNLQRRPPTPTAPTDSDLRIEGSDEDERDRSLQQGYDVRSGPSQPEGFQDSEIATSNSRESAEQMTIPDDGGEEYRTEPEATSNSIYQMDGNVWTPPAEEKKSRGFPFVGGFRIMAKLRKKSKYAPMEPQNPPSPEPINPPPPIPVLSSSPRSFQATSPPKKPAITPIQPLQRVQSQRAPQKWYTARQEAGRSPVVPEARVELAKSDTPTGSTTTSNRSSKSSRYSALAARPQEAPTSLPNPHESQLVTADPESIAEPIQIHPQPAPDYDRMSSSSIDIEYHADSFSTHMYRLGRCIKHFIRLPWEAYPRTLEYYPGESERAQSGKTSQSWYTKPGQEKVDLLANPAPVRQPPRSNVSRSGTRPRERSRHHGAATHSRSRHRHHHSPPTTDVATAIRPAKTPMSATSAGAAPMSPGASSHGHGRHSYSYSYYYQAPRPMYVYPATVFGKTPGGRGGSPKSDVPQAAVPVYMLAAPPAHMAHHGRHRTNHHHHALKSPTTSPSRGTRIASPDSVLQ